MCPPVAGVLNWDAVGLLWVLSSAAAICGCPRLTAIVCPVQKLQTAEKLAWKIGGLMDLGVNNRHLFVCCPTVPKDTNMILTVLLHKVLALKTSDSPAHGLRIASTSSLTEDLRTAIGE